MERRAAAFRPRRFLTRAFVAALGFVALAAVLAYAARTRGGRGPYELADDCPRGALVYAQVSDLPELLRLWEGSALRERYLASTNYKQFANGHVGLKLYERANEFADALGFTPEASALADVTEKKAAFAVYDIGKLEFVFVALVSEEKALAARFFSGKGNALETELSDGTVFYSADVDADRRRQRQKVLYAFVKGRFVLATSESLMMRALANVNNKSRSDRLSDEPSFKALSRELSPHFAAVWVDQTRLNADHYFKHYWAMGDAARLRKIRAGLFDFEMREGSWIERREYLVEGREHGGDGLTARDLEALGASVPAEAAYARLRAITDGAAGASALVRDTMLDRAPEAGAGGGSGGGGLHEGFDPSESGSGYEWDGGYWYLDSDYDAAIDDTDEGGEGEASVLNEKAAGARALAGLEATLARARPVQAAVAESPLTHEGPLFVEFRRLAVLRLEEPGRLDRRAFETAVASLVAGRLTVASGGEGLSWSDGGEGARSRRELVLPMLGWKLCYALRGGELFVSNDAGLLEAALTGGGVIGRGAGSGFTPDDVTVVRLEARDQAFDRVFARLDAERVKEYRAGRIGGESAPSEEFFSGNVASLLGVTSPVGRVEIRRRTTRGRMRVEVEAFFGAGR